MTIAQRYAGFLRREASALAPVKAAAMRQAGEHIEAREIEIDKARNYARSLAIALHDKHYSEDEVEWDPSDDLIGLLTQIDNMMCGLISND